MSTIDDPRAQSSAPPPPESRPDESAPPRTHVARSATARPDCDAAGEGAREARAGPVNDSVALEAAIEAERARLLQARAVLKCLYEVLLYRDDEDSVVYAETVEVAAKLVSEAIDRLDTVRLRPLMDVLERTVPQGTRDASVPHNKVEDAPPRYLC